MVAHAEPAAVLEPTKLPSPISVLLVDDQRAVLAGVRALVDGEAPAMQVTGLARTGSEALDLARRTRPRVIVLDLELGTENGLNLVEALRAASGAEIVVLSGAISGKARQRAEGLGVTQFLLKSEPGEALIRSIRNAVEPLHAAPMTSVTPLGWHK